MARKAIPRARKTSAKMTLLIVYYTDVIRGHILMA